MTLVQSDVLEAAAVGVAETTTLEGLSVLRQPDCAGAIWKRQLTRDFQRWIDTVDPERLPLARLILRPEHVGKALSEIFETCGTPACRERDYLSDDAVALSRKFADLMQTPYLRLRFDVVSTNACRKFHIDTVTARLICTYRGPGTEYGFSTEDGTLGDICSIETGTPFLLRGKLWPESPDAGLRHRSPPIEGTGVTRLVLVLDPIADPDAHSEQKYPH